MSHLVPRAELASAAAGTYLGEILAARDSSLARWPERDEPLRVWIAARSPVADWEPVYAARVREAFGDWERAGVPLRFAFVGDSAMADVHVSWIDRFDEPISGRTLWWRDESWWITDADIAIAIHHSRGAPLDAAAVKAIALHEVGHLLGLDHTADERSVRRRGYASASSPRPTAPPRAFSTPSRPAPSADAAPPAREPRARP